MGAHKGRPYTKQRARFLPPQERQGLSYTDTRGRMRQRWQPL